MKRLPELNAYLKGNLIVKVNRPIIGKREPQMETLDAVSFLKGFLQEGLTFLRDFDYTATIRMDEWGNLSKHIKTLENVWVTHDEYEHAQKEIDDMQKELDRRIKAQELREHDETLQREKESEGEAFAKHYRTMVAAKRERRETETTGTPTSMAAYNALPPAFWAVPTPKVGQ